MLHYEIGLPVFVALILGAGVAALSTAAPDGELTRQIVFLGVAFVACAGILWLGLQRILPHVYTIYVVAIALLVLTKFFGAEINGARSWLYIGPLPGFQPSELAKMALILALAVSLHERPIENVLHYLRPAFLIGLPCALVLLEPDLGGVMMLAAAGAGILLVRGVPRWHLILCVVIVAVAVPTVGWPNLKPHQRERLEIFVNPAADPQGSGYQVIQSRIAIGSGGLTGKGYGQGTQSQLGFIPYRQTDFIYAVIAEEGGFIAAAGLLLLYGLLFWRLVEMLAECPLDRNRLIIAGVLSLLGFQMLVNVGVTLGLAPVTGVTLPLVSYGGTSLVSTLMLLSIAYVAHRDRFIDW
ncbi:MAG: rod shape-determining protein RodA [Trueperaceae bacterium]|nr:rod shape-determining protein RodA [Trueperaceae bacterium]